MTTFADVLPPAAPLDATEHVRFVSGMVLAAGDFEQEFAYHHGRDTALARDLHGSGTLSGLRVWVDDEDGPRVHVGAGVAVTPCGELVCVAPDQCADLDAWLAEHEDELVVNADDTVDVHVVLGPLACPTTPMPIPGDPCRSADELTAPTRLRDGFTLELRARPPAQPDEDAVTGFVAWLRQVEIADDGTAGADELVEALRKAVVHAEESEPPGVTFKPPEDVKLKSADAVKALGAAVAVWTSEIRPLLRTPGTGCGCPCGCGSAEDHAELEDVVRLATLNLDLTEAPDAEGPPKVEGDPRVQDARPLLAQTRLLQELALGVLSGGGRQGPAGQDGTNGTNGVDGAPGPSYLVAAGEFTVKTEKPVWTWRARVQALRREEGGEPIYVIQPPEGAEWGKRTLIKGTVRTATAAEFTVAFEQVHVDTRLRDFLASQGIITQNIVLRLRRPSEDAPAPVSFSFEVSSFPEDE